MVTNMAITMVMVMGTTKNNKSDLNDFLSCLENTCHPEPVEGLINRNQRFNPKRLYENKILGS